MRPAGKAKTVAYVSAGFLALTAVVGGAAVALGRSDSPPASSPSRASSSLKQLVPVVPTVSPRPTPASRSGDEQAAPPVASDAALKVPPLGALTPPDLIVTLRHAAAPGRVTWLRRRTGVRRVAVADRGWVTIHGVRLRTLGVPLSIRGFTPSLTGGSKALWQSIARGELTIAYANGRHLRRHLGQTFFATGTHGAQSPLRIGAFATIGLDGAQALLSHPAAASLGLRPRRTVLVAAPKIALSALTADVHKAFGSSAKVDVTRAVPVDQSQASSYATSSIPATYLDLYRRAAVTCPGLPWTVLAGIGTVETGNGRNVHRSTAGAEGPMQFLPSTWKMYGYDADGDGKADILDPTDAVFSAARYLCAAGAGRGGQSLDNAIFSYNHAWWYVREVVTIANHYA